MRVRFEFNASPGSKIPIDYHYFLSSAVYGWMKEGNEEIAARYHYSKGLKPFTFSEIYLKGSKAEGEELLIKDEFASLTFSSIFPEVVEAVVSGALSSGKLSIKDVDFQLTGVKVLEEPEFTGRMRFKTLSPVAISVKENGKKRYLYPTEVEWYVYLEKNLRKRYRDFLGEEYSGRVEIKLIRMSKAKRYNILGGYVRAAKVEMEIRGSPEIIRVAYQSGIGEKTAQGFGCLEVLKTS